MLTPTSANLIVVSCRFSPLAASFEPILSIFFLLAARKLCLLSTLMFV